MDASTAAAAAGRFLIGCAAAFDLAPAGAAAGFLRTAGSSLHAGPHDRLAASQAARLDE